MTPAKPLDPMPEEPDQPRRIPRRSQLDLKRSQSRGDRASQRAGKIERVFREMDEESGR